MGNGSESGASLKNPLIGLRHRLALREGTDAAGTVERISSGASLSAENLWMLGCSALLASIGLDTGSPAVVIGAMLISPLMGPILGVGLGMGVTDRNLLQHSLRELALATGLVLAASMAYFLLSPLATPTTELIARTKPTLLDVGVAFFGGVAGIVAGSRRRPSMAIPGVAIATALMPPLCTAGFGLATLNWRFFFGAFYLYGLNAVFIALSTFLVVRFLKFPHHEEPTPEMRLRERRLVTAVALAAALPSAWFLYQVATDVRQQRRINSFVENEIEAPGRAVPQWERVSAADSSVLKVYIAGHPVEGPARDSLAAAMPRYGLRRVSLELIQSDVSAEALRRLQGDVQRAILGAVTGGTAVRDSAARVLLGVDSSRLGAAARELAAAFPEIAALTWAPRSNLLAHDSAQSPPAMIITFSAGVGTAERRAILPRVQALLAERLQIDSVVLIGR